MSILPVHYVFISPFPFLISSFLVLPPPLGEARAGRFYHVSEDGRENLMCVGEQDRNSIYAYALRTVKCTPTLVWLLQGPRLSKSCSSRRRARLTYLEYSNSNYRRLQYSNHRQSQQTNVRTIDDRRPGDRCIAYLWRRGQ